MLPSLIAARNYAEAEASEAGRALQSYPKLANGLTPDAIKFSPEYRAAKARYEMARDALRYINGQIARARRQIS